MILYAKLFSPFRLASAVSRAILGALTAECRVCHWSQPSRAPLGQGGENQMRILIAVIVIVIVIRIEFRR